MCDDARVTKLTFETEHLMQYTTKDQETITAYITRVEKRVMENLTFYYFWNGKDFVMSLTIWNTNKITIRRGTKVVTYF